MSEIPTPTVPTTAEGAGNNTGVGGGGENNTQPGNASQPAPTPGEQEKKFTQSDLDRLIARRLDEEKDRQQKAIAKEREAAEAKRLEEQGQWKELYDKAQAEGVRLQGEIDRLAMDALKARVADRAKLPADLAERLQGATEEDLKKDAERLARLFAPRAPDAEGGPRPRGPAATTEQEVRAQLASGRYGF